MCLLIWNTCFVLYFEVYNKNVAVLYNNITGAARSKFLQGPKFLLLSYICQSLFAAVSVQIILTLALFLAKCVSLLPHKFSLLFTQILMFTVNDLIIFLCQFNNITKRKIYLCYKQCISIAADIVTKA
jgi:hypothetical protein